jgi:hypothetical protein
VLTTDRQVADLVGRACRKNVDAPLAEVVLRAALQLDRLGRVGGQTRRILTETVLQLAGRHLHARDLDFPIAVEIDHRVRPRPPALLDELRLRGRRLGHRSCDVARVHQSLCAERFAIADEEVHGRDHGLTFRAVAHPAFLVGEFHVFLSRRRALAGRPPAAVPVSRSC